MNSETQKILWIDDQIEQYTEFVDGLTDRGFSVTTASSVKEGLAITRRAFFDLILVDLRMGRESGFDFIRRSRFTQRTAVCIFSSYLHLPDNTKRINNLRRHFGTFDKDLPDPDTPNFDIFVAKLRSIIKNPPSQSPKAFASSFMSGVASPFDVTYRDYLLLPSTLKKKLQKEAADIASKTLHREFSNGNQWVLLCGNADEPALVAEEGRIPSNEKVVSTAMENDRAPFVFSAPDSVDDLWSGSCEAPGNVKSYPTVTLSLGDMPVNAHFDTGAPISFSDFELLSELGLLEAGLVPVSGKRGYREYEYVNYEINSKIYDQHTGSSKAIKLRARAVKDWKNCPYVVHCQSSCPKFKSETRKPSQCENRSALIGRNILFDNSIQLTICGASNKTTISKKRTLGRK